MAGRTPLGVRYVEAVIRPRRAMVRSVLERGVAEGVLRPDLDVALLADILVGPIILRKILNELADSSDEMPDASRRFAPRRLAPRLKSTSRRDRFGEGRKAPLDHVLGSGQARSGSSPVLRWRSRARTITPRSARFIAKA